MRFRFDDVFDYVGGFGPYQLTLFFMVGMGALQCSEVINMNFIGYMVDHWCYIEELKDFPYECQKEIAIPQKENGMYHECLMYDFNYSSYSVQDFLNWDTKSMVTNQTRRCSRWVYDRSVMTANMVTEYDLVCGREWEVQMVSTAYMAGFLVGAVPCGLISDSIGRKPAVFGFILVKIGASFLSTYAPSYTALAIGRFLVGIGSMGVYTIFFVLVVEVVGPKYRSLVGISFNMLLHVGYMLVAAFAFAIRDWTNLQLLMAGPACTLVLLWWVVPESPRWLVLHGRMEEAEKELRFMAAVNRQEIPPGFDLTDVRVPTGDRPGGLSIIFTTPFLRKRTMILYFQWFTIDLLFYSFSLNTGSMEGDVFLTTFLMAVVGFPAGILCTLGMNWKRLGRRLTSSFSLLLSGIASMASFVIIILQVAPEVATGLAVFGKFAITISMACAYVYTSELYPTAVRNAAVGSASMVARVSAMAAPYVGGPLAEVWAPLPSLIYGVFSILSGIFTLFLPETFGKTLQETMGEAEARNRGMSTVYHENRNTNGYATSYPEYTDPDPVRLNPSNNVRLTDMTGTDNYSFDERF